MSMVQRWLWSATVCALLVLMSAPAWAQYDQCARFTNCQSCAAQGACGWCGAAGRCMAGGSGGSPYCAGGWAWTTNACVQVGVPVPSQGYAQPVPVQGAPYDQCTRFTNCQSCAAQGACGWCGAQGRCMAGGSNGSPYCQGAWSWTTNTCPQVYPQPQQVYPVPGQGGQYDQCTRFTNCQACAAQGACGWCGAQGRCMGGTSNGSPYCQGAWAWLTNACPSVYQPQPVYPRPVPVGPYDACARYTSCGPCAADASCGWCGASGRCLTGQANGSPYCPGAWAWTDNQCPAVYPGGYQGAAQPVYPAPGNVQQGYPVQVAPRQVYPQQGYPQQGVPAQVVPQQGYPAPGYPQQGYAAPPPVVP